MSPVSSIINSQHRTVRRTDLKDYREVWRNGKIAVLARDYSYNKFLVVHDVIGQIGNPVQGHKAVNDYGKMVRGVVGRAKGNYRRMILKRRQAQIDLTTKYLELKSYEAESTGDKSIHREEKEIR